MPLRTVFPSPIHTEGEQFSRLPPVGGQRLVSCLRKQHDRVVAESRYPEPSAQDRGLSTSWVESRGSSSLESVALAGAMGGAVEESEGSILGRFSSYSEVRFVSEDYFGQKLFSTLSIFVKTLPRETQSLHSRSCATPCRPIWLTKRLSIMVKPSTSDQSSFRSSMGALESCILLVTTW